MSRLRMAFLLVPVACALLACSLSCKARAGEPQVIINGHTFSVEIAAAEAARNKGLSGRSNLPPDRGMLFLFADAMPLQFYMKDCYFDIDIAFIDADKRIVNLETMPVEADPANPRRLYNSDRPCKYVLETVGGTWKRIGAQPGMVVTLVNTCSSVP
jgi:uncharacterized protein